MAQVVLRDGLVDFDIPGTQYHYPVLVVPNIALAFVLAGATCNADPAGAYFVIMVKEGDTAPDPPGPEPEWLPDYSFIYDSAIIQSPDLIVPWTFEFTITPSKPYLQLLIAHSPLPENKGPISVIGEYELMDEAIYNRLMRAKRVSLKQIEACTGQVDEHEAAKVAANAKKEELELEMALFDNFLSDEIDAYELLNP